MTNRVGTTGAFWPDEICQIMRAWDVDRQRQAARELGATRYSDPTYAIVEYLKDVPRQVRDESIAALRSWSDRARHRAERVLLSWEELDTMAASGVDIEAHGVTHDMLTGLDRSDVMTELTGSRLTLLERGHGRRGLFAYPAGRYNPVVCRLTAEAGYVAAFTIERGLVERRSAVFALPRLMLHEGMSSSSAEFLMRVPGWS